MIDYSHGEYRHCTAVTSSLTTGPGEGSAAGTGRGEGTGSATSMGRGEGTGSAASTGGRECTGTTPNVQQWLVPSQIRCALGNLARASLSAMQAGEPLASDDPIMIAPARIGIMRIVIAITLLEEKRPRPLFGPGPSSALLAVLFRGQTTVVSDALCRFQNASDAPPADARNVTESRKSCEVPSFPSSPQVPRERPPDC
jgi:hypothetical protein